MSSAILLTCLVLFPDNKTVYISYILYIFLCKLHKVIMDKTSIFYLFQISLEIIISIEITTHS